MRESDELFPLASLGERGDRKAVGEGVKLRTAPTGKSLPDASRRYSCLEQILMPCLFQRLDRFTHILGAVSRANQERVIRLDNHKILNTHGDHKFLFGYDNVAP